MSSEFEADKAGNVAQRAWHALDAEEVLRDLRVHENGLASEEAAQRLQRHGHNQLQEAARPGFLATLWDQLNSFVVIHPFARHVDQDHENWFVRDGIVVVPKNVEIPAGTRIAPEQS